ncbi:splicing factor U2af small subunit B-like [Cryptomeria japonica]|uniref:splicing factor U2af small subunit B-like n=1 Tax=Cryptomeria japonica TaxID=3369 RepID=UPI0027DA165C|nr:splicing factor U2af small subunit B-like [Cryptomeria japonica]
MSLAGQIWDYGAGVVDVGMTEEFSTYFMAYAVACISDSTELLPSFDDDEEQHPQRPGGARQREEYKGEEVGEGGGGGGRGYGGGGDGGGRGGAKGRSGRGGLVLSAGGGGRLGAVLAIVGGIEDDRQPAQRKRSNVLSPTMP